jgi:hypothetical protein
VAWIIIGSTALAHWFPDWNREPKDIDLLSDVTIKPGNGQFVVDAHWHEAAPLLIKASKNKTFLDPDLLLTLKVSHAPWDIKWGKTMFDIDFLYSKGLEVNEELHAELIKVWKRVHGPKKVNMTQTVDVFFNDCVPRLYDHEVVHEHVAFYDRPMHELLRPDPKTVWCSVERFNQLSFDDQCKTVLEEMMTVAIERANLTLKSSVIDYRRAIHNASFKLITSMTTGWFSRFIIRHHRHLLIERKELWVPQIKKALTSLSQLPKSSATSSTSPTA